MNADHFRKRATDARVMARSGDDPRIAAMLLDLAKEMDAEAALIEAGLSGDDGRASSSRVSNIRALLHAPPGGPSRWLMLTALARGGARLRGSTEAVDGDEVILEVPRLDLRVFARVIHASGADIAVAFAADSTSRRGVERAVRWLDEPHPIGV